MPNIIIGTAFAGNSRGLFCAQKFCSRSCTFLFHSVKETFSPFPSSQHQD